MVWHTGGVQGQRDMEIKESDSSGERLTLKSEGVCMENTPETSV